MFFTLTSAPIVPATCRDQLQHPHAGGYVSFEGWVRNHHESRSVTSLAYEAYPELATHEAEAILSEAMARFAVVDVACVHRTGALAIGECAVWVGVSAAHRQAAFDACQYMIDAIKQRVPIWKHETYTDGTQAWVNCHACAQANPSQTVPSHAGPAPQMPDVSHMQRYARQMILPEVGRIGQNRLQQSRVLVVGAGGLGSTALSYLAGAGIGTLGICDADRLDATNLHRQVLYRDADIGQPKAELAKAALLALNPTCRIHTYPYALTPENAAEMLAPYDVIIDGTDTMAAKFALSDAAVALQKPVVFASVHQYEGQLWCYIPSSGSSPCVRCLWPPSVQDDEPAPSCAQTGVLGVTPGLLGVLQATQVLKYLLKLPGTMAANDLWLVDLLSLTTTSIQRHHQPGCSCCTPHAMTARHASSHTPNVMPPTHVQPSSSSLISLQEALPLSASCLWVDIRGEQAEGGVEHPLLVHAVRLESTRDVAEWLAQQPAKRIAILVCQEGLRSQPMVRALRRQGYAQVYALAGGASALLQHAGCFTTTMV
jgi:molybdopterin/thiamine biosynthesis adenylyltransferase/molybdopterin synthase catalytic subunit/rhodanese-related sulfurtransferase